MKWRYAAFKKKKKEKRIIIVMMIEDLKKAMEKMQEMFTKDLQELKNKQR